MFNLLTGIVTGISVGVVYVKRDPCLDNPCGTDACIRIDGFNYECDRCFNIECENGKCNDGVCNCDDGFVNVNNTCQQTCASEPCQDQ